MSTEIDKCDTPRRTCKCKPLCAECGWGRHAAVHLPPFGKPNAKPYDHEFKPAAPTSIEEK